MAWNLVSNFLRTSNEATWSGAALAGSTFASARTPIKSSGVSRPLLRTAFRNAVLRAGRLVLVGTLNSGQNGRRLSSVVHSGLFAGCLHRFRNISLRWRRRNLSLMLLFRVWREFDEWIWVDQLGRFGTLLLFKCQNIYSSKGICEFKSGAK